MWNHERILGQEDLIQRGGSWYHLSVKGTLLNLVVFYALMSVVSLLTVGCVTGQEAPPTEDAGADSGVTGSKLSFLMDLHAGLGAYDKLSMRSEELPSSTKTSSDACFLRAEVGFKSRSIGAAYHVEYLWSPVSTFVGRQEYISEGDLIHHGIRAFWLVARRNFTFAPEGSYIFVRERAWILCRSGERLDQSDQEYRDGGCCYGLSARFKVISIHKGGLWLYGRYVHDDLEIKVDSYGIEIQLGGLNLNPTQVDQKRHYAESAFFGLGIRWARRTDGRSEQFLTVSLTGAMGLF